MFLLARIFPIERSTIKSNLPPHLLFSLLLGVSVRVAIPELPPYKPMTIQRALSDIVNTFDYQAMVNWVMLATHQAALYYT